MKIKKLWLVLVAILLCSIAYAAYTDFTTLTSPSANYAWTIGVDNLTFEATVVSNSTHSASNASLYSNVSGTWALEYSNTSNSSINNTFIYNFPAANTKFGIGNTPKHIAWGVKACLNKSVNGFCEWSANRTIIASFPTVANTLGTPADLSYTLLGSNVTPTNWTYTNSVVPPATYGVINATLWTNVTGAWEAYATRGINTTTSTAGATLNYTFLPQHIFMNYTDGKNILWNIKSCINISDGALATCNFASANRTVLVQQRPQVKLITPATLATVNTTAVTINVSVEGDGSYYDCYVYTNETNNWSIQSTLTLDNESTDSSTLNFNGPGHYLWNMRCLEEGNANIYGFNETNSTLYIVTGAPTVTINSPAETFYKNSANLVVNLTVTGELINYCQFNVNKSGRGNTTNISSVPTGGASMLMSFNASSSSAVEINKHYMWNITCKNSAGFNGTSATYTMISDTTFPKIVKNLTGTEESCSTFTLKVEGSEDINATIDYGKILNTYPGRETNTSFSNNVTLTGIEFNYSYDTTYYYNLTIKDRAGNINWTYAPAKVRSPVKLCTGWSIYGIYDPNINLSTLYSQIGADYLYWYNNTGQSWTYYSTASTSSYGTNVSFGKAVHIYESGNTTWFRNRTGTRAYKTNMSTGHVYLPIYWNFTFGDLTYRQFRNSTMGVYANKTQPKGAEFDFGYFSGYNNSNHRYVNYITGWTSNNGTYIGKNLKNGLDVLWTYSSDNLSINMSSPATNGHIYANWTRSD